MIEVNLIWIIIVNNITRQGMVLKAVCSLYDQLVILTMIFPNYSEFATYDDSRNYMTL